VTPVLVGVGAALACTALVWLIASMVRSPRRSSRRVVRTVRVPAASTFDARQSSVIRDAERALTAAQEEAKAIVAAAEARAAEVQAEAAEAARSLVRAAEEMNRELVSAGAHELVSRQQAAERIRRELEGVIRGLIARVDDEAGDSAAGGRTSPDVLDIRRRARES